MVAGCLRPAQAAASAALSHLSILDLTAQAIAVLFRNFSPVPISSRLFPTFFSINFNVSGFIASSLIHLDLSFVQGDKNGSIHILLHDNRQLCQHHLLKMPSSFHWRVFSSLRSLGKKIFIRVCVHLWVSNSVPLVSLSVPIPVPCSFYHYCSVITA